jgi:hypothetical protein
MVNLEEWSELHGEEREEPKLGHRYDRIAAAVEAQAMAELKERIEARREWERQQRLDMHEIEERETQ